MKKTYIVVAVIVLTIGYFIRKQLLIEEELDTPVPFERHPNTTGFITLARLEEIHLAGGAYSFLRFSGKPKQNDTDFYIETMFSTYWLTETAKEKFHNPEGFELLDCMKAGDYVVIDVDGRLVDMISGEHMDYIRANAGAY